MRFFITLFYVMSLANLAIADQSDVYRCRFEDPARETSVIRMKKYYDTVQGMYLGKVDLLQDFIETESTATKVYQIPFQDQKKYMQIWYSRNLRVDAQFSYSQSVRKFRAVYTKNSDKFNLFCIQLGD